MKTYDARYRNVHDRRATMAAGRFGSGLNDPRTRAPGSSENQYTFEAYWRWQASKHLRLVPDIQLIVNPANNPSIGRVWVSGLRVRAAF
ncbi:MAG: carbohydrate porin [Gammaproteobacteria bacterium]|jgi:carbohydrate-selective porin OprB|nr:carbohydrate porin [Gammaproteobacteria bacterium]MDH5286879.1 carbohydrate porin [Betaproteobacteria bacterium]